MRPSYVNSNKLNDAYHVVDNFICENYQKKHLNKKQLHDITHAAFQSLRHQQDPCLSEWRKKGVIQETSKQKLREAVQDILVSTESPWQASLNPQSKLQSLVYNTLRGNLPGLKDLSKQHAMLKAVIWKKNPEMMGEVRALVQDMFDSIAVELNQAPISSEKTLHMEILIGDLLSLYPFLSPESGEILKVPMQIDGAWQLVDYKVEKIPLTPPWMGSPLVAFGLSPKQPDAPPLLLFKGTTYPADSGFTLSLLTDLNPGSVGTYAFRLGQKKIQAWLNDQTATSNAVIYGKSLGGALAWRTALHFPDKVNKVMAYGAPGFSTNDLNRLKQMTENSSTPEINLFCQKNDLIPILGKTAPQGVNYYLLLGEERKGLLAHADIYSTHNNSTVLRMPYYHNLHRWRRLKLNILKSLASYVVFPAFLIAHAQRLAAKKTISLTKRAIKRIH